MAYEVINPGDLNDHLPSQYGLSCYDTLEWDECLVPHCAGTD